MGAYIPDLSGAWMKGREYAIDRNWNDLANYEKIEAARNANDLSAIDILGQRAQFGGRMNIFQNNVDSSARANEVAEAAQPGLLANADAGSMMQQDQRSAFMANRSDYQQMLANTAQANIGRGIDAAAVQNSTNAWWTPERTAQMGVWAGENGYNTGMANNITGAHAPQIAAQQNVLGDERFMNDRLGLQYANGEISNNIALQPEQHKLEGMRIGNRQYDEKHYVEDKQAQAERQQQMRRDELRQRISLLTAEWRQIANDPTQVARMQQLRMEIDMLNRELNGQPAGAENLMGGGIMPANDTRGGRYIFPVIGQQPATQAAVAQSAKQYAVTPTPVSQISATHAPAGTVIATQTPGLVRVIPSYEQGLQQGGFGVKDYIDPNTNLPTGIVELGMLPGTPDPYADENSLVKWWVGAKSPYVASPVR